MSRSIPGQGPARPTDAAVRSRPGAAPRPGEEPPPLLRLWRVVPPGALGVGSARSLDLVLRTVTPPCNVRSWDAVLRGDAAATARVALTVFRIAGVNGAAADTVASALLAATLRGDRTAPVIMAAALRRLARHRPEDRHLGELAARWLAWAPRVPARRP